MAQVFISHSRHDCELVNNIKIVIENIGHTAYLYEYEEHPDDSAPDSTIMSQIRISAFVFVFLTKNIDSREHTKSWVISEVAIARDMDKRTFVFEHEGEYVSFPFPYLTDYMIFDKQNVQHILTLQKIAKKHFPPPPELPPGLVGGGLGALIGSTFGPLGTIIGGLLGVNLDTTSRSNEIIEIPSMIIRCPLCNMEYNYYSPWIKEFPCPKCRRWLEVK